MKTLYFRATWGMPEMTVEGQLEKIRAGGYDGVEMGAPENGQLRKDLRSILNQLGLALITQIWTVGNTPADHARSFESQYRRASELQPVWVNAHTGKDYFTSAENLSIVALANALENEVGVPVVHEVHRGRMTFSAPAAEVLLLADPRIRLTADFSHWCCVHESLLADQSERLDLAIRRSNHIHARVGHPEGPQVNDPRAPEWREAVETHVNWWQRITEQNRAQGADRLTITPEFGPPDYMAVLPYTRQPVADLWDINLYMKDMLKERLA